jgi:UDP-2,3-diacylglucosamine hydrolase
VKIPRPSVFLISDAHLGSGPDSEARSARLVRLLDRLRERASHLYILGDLFDFWFEYRHAVPKGHFRILRALADLVDDGVAVAYLGGNHDFWCGSYLEREVGVEVHQRPIRVEHQGRRLLLAHGDGIGPGDTGYRILKRILRHPLAIAGYRLLHPDLGIPFAHCVSGTSRRHTKGRTFYLRQMSRHLVAPAFDAGCDAVIVGHVHDPLHLRGERNREFLIIGDWLEFFTYVRLEEGRLSLLQDREGEPPATLPPAPWPEGLGPGD